MTIRTRLALLSPVWALAVRKSHDAARLTAEVRRLTHDLAVVTADRDALRERFALATAERERARDLAVAMFEPACGPTDAEFDEFLKDCNERGPA